MNATAETTQSSSTEFARPQGRGSSEQPTSSRGVVIAYWTFTALFSLQMGFTAYAHLTLPQAAQVFGHLGFPDYFRIELSVAKLVGIVALLLPIVPAVVKEWAYAGFTIILGSALIAHLAVGDGPAAWSWSVGTFVLQALSYYFYRRQLSAKTTGR